MSHPCDALVVDRRFGRRFLGRSTRSGRYFLNPCSSYDTVGLKYLYILILLKKSPLSLHVFLM